MHRLIYKLNGKYVEVNFTFDKGYDATFDDPGCPDDCEVHQVFYPHDVEPRVDILPVMHDDDKEAIYSYIFSYKGEDDD